MSIAATVGIPVITGVQACIHDGFVALDNLKVNQRFLLYLLKASEGTLREAGQSGSQMNVNTNIVKGLHVWIPGDRSEQERIATALWDTDDLIAILERLIAKKQAIKQGMMQQLLTGLTRLPGFYGDWITVALADIADKRDRYSLVGGPFGSSLTAAEYTVTGVRILQLQNIGDGEFRDDYAIYTSDHKADELRSSNIYPGDLLLAKMGDPVARACVVPAGPSRYQMASDGIRLSVDKTSFDPRLIMELINSSDFRAAADAVSIGSTRKRISLGQLRRLQMRLPSELSEQNAISDSLCSIDNEVALLKVRLTKARAIKTSMMQQLLNGRTRLPMEAVS